MREAKRSFQITLPAKTRPAFSSALYSWPAWVHRRKATKPSHPERVRKGPGVLCLGWGGQRCDRWKASKSYCTFNFRSQYTLLISSNPTHLPQYFSKYKSLSNSISITITISISMRHLFARVPIPSYTNVQRSSSSNFEHGWLLWEPHIHNIVRRQGAGASTAALQPASRTFHLHSIQKGHKRQPVHCALVSSSNNHLCAILTSTRSRLKLHHEIFAVF